MIRVFAKALSEVMNWSSMALSKSQTFSWWSTKPRISTEILILRNIMRSRLGSPTAHIMQHQLNYFHQ